AYAAATAGRSPTEGQGRRRRDIVTTALRLGVLGPPPVPPAEEVRPLRGRRHTRSRDRRAVSHHYDVGNDFYRLVLGPTLVYSCAYWTRPGDPAYTLEDAQRDKLDLVGRKLGLHEPGPARRLLDVGCRWGSMVLHAARAHGVRAVGITVSAEQAEAARQRVKEARLDERVEIRLQDYRDVDDGPYDATSSIGMAEHVGTATYPTYARRLYDLLREGGRLLNHQIAARPGTWVDAPSFTSRYVFPDGELVAVGETVRLLEEAGFEVRDLEALREHYGRTLRAWVANLENSWDEAVRLTSPARARVWRLYLAGSAVGFEANRLGVHQVLAVRPTSDGRSLLPVTRRQWLGAA
ncbi:MAG: cyclopropane-fatty-acyl-phospholipid synthase family protein, partial [Actinomycetota bacterium]|nr:cyclopropane-fatty-acyl-phospholipid synthase family protein [Actinomycetota bacterium]